MSEFKQGDRVKFNSPRSVSGTVYPWRPENTGTILRKWFNFDGSRQLGYKVRWDGHFGEFQHNTENLTQVEPSKLAHADVIGKAPEVKTPRHFGPFKANGVRVEDANGETLARGDSDHEDYEYGDDTKIAEVIAAALNAYFEESK